LAPFDGLESFVEPLDDLSRGKIRRWPIASNSDSRLSIRTADGSKADSDRNTSTANTNLDVRQQESECFVDIAVAIVENERDGAMPHHVRREQDAATTRTVDDENTHSAWKD
jgi:hypothetical protein